MENAGIKVHMGFSNAKGVISHLTITEGTGSERAQVRAEEYGAGLKNTLDLGYVNYDGELNYNRRNQDYLIRYRTNVQETVIMDMAKSPFKNLLARHLFANFPKLLRLNI